MKPDSPLVRSVIVIFSPCAVSCSVTRSKSPGLYKSTSGVNVNVAPVASSGLGGATGTPLLVIHAQFTYSSPPAALHAALLSWPVFAFVERLSMLSAEDHRFGLPEPVKYNPIPARYNI